VKKILLGLIAIIFANSVNASDYTERNAVNQISEYFNKTDLSLIPKPKDISISIDVTIEDSGERCKYQNQYLNYGNDVYPKISDPKRVKAIVELITKIINCEQLPFKEDGQTFLNKEGKLPPMPKGYYQEYTLIVPKDAAKDFYIGDTHFTAYPSYGARGPERIVIGGGKTIYYTPTHYDSFVEIKLINSKSDSNR
jgi:guanyl-specific ribonuclease Sa